jgi:Ca-activated chloride channel homolog
MRVFRTITVLILVLAGTRGASSQLPPSLPSASPPAPPPEGPAVSGGAGFRLRADVNLVVVEATVRDQDGRIVNDLAQENFHIYEDGVEQQIRHFSRDELPLAIALVVDASGSMGPALRQLHRVAYDTFSALKPDDRVALFEFAARAKLRVSLTRNLRSITDGIAGIRAGGATVIPDALFEAARYLTEAAPDRRHDIILISDNENTLKGYADEKRVIREALESEAVIYSIQVEQELHPHSMNVLLPIFRDVSVAKITHETGGEVIDAKNIESIGPAMATTISRLKQRYSLAYGRPDGAFREIEIRVTDASKDPRRRYIVYARRGYYARTEGTSSLSPSTGSGEQFQALGLGL